MVLSVVVRMQGPQESVHDVLVGGPGNELHEGSRAYDDPDDPPRIHDFLNNELGDLVPWYY